MKTYVFSDYGQTFRVSYLTNGIGSTIERLFINEVKSEVGGIVTPGICAQAAPYNLPKIGVEITHAVLVAKAAEFSLNLLTYEDGESVGTVATALNNGCALTAFSIPSGQAAVIATLPNSAGKYTIAINVPYGTDITDVAATFTKTTGATVKVGGAAQTSGATTQDFDAPIDYEVTAANGIDKKYYTILVTELANTACLITAFSIPGGSAAVINNGAGTITTNVAHDTDVIGLAATFTTSHGATVTVDELAQVSTVTENDFTSAVVYLVTAEDGETTKEYTVTITILPE